MKKQTQKEFKCIFCMLVFIMFDKVSLIIYFDNCISTNFSESKI